MEHYLELKRLSFPRFYFLSNYDLLQILSQSRNPDLIQPNLRKCFECISKVFYTVGENGTIILGMVSTEPEKMPETV